MIIKYVKKDSGYRQRFNLKKLERAISYALRHAGTDAEGLAKRVAHETMEYLEGKGKEIVDSDSIRQTVMHVLREDGEHKAADAYELSVFHTHGSKISQIIKRGGEKETFHPQKLFKSIKKSFVDAGIGENAGKVTEQITKEIIERLLKEHQGRAIPSEAIRKLTASLLKEKGFKKVERSYLLHKYL